MAVNQLRTHLIARSTFSWRSLIDRVTMTLCTTFFGVTWRIKKNDHQNTVFSCSVLEWWCSRELVLRGRIPCLNETVGGQMLLYFKGRSGNCDHMTCIIWIWVQMNRFFYRNNSWVLKSRPDCRTLSWRILSFGVRLAKASCFLGIRAKGSWILSNLKRNFHPVIFVQTDCICKTQARMLSCDFQVFPRTVYF